MNNEYYNLQNIKNIPISAGMSVEDMSRHYGGYKDLNEYHISRQKAMEQRQKKPLSVVKRGFRR